MSKIKNKPEEKNEIIQKLCPKCKVIYIGKKCENCFNIENKIIDKGDEE